MEKTDNKKPVTYYTVPQMFMNGGVYATSTAESIPPGDYVARADYEKLLEGNRLLQKTLNDVLSVMRYIDSTTTSAEDTLLDRPEVDLNATCHRCGRVFQREEHGGRCGCAIFLGSEHPSQGY
jgi:hypothetical protein